MEATMNLGFPEMLFIFLLALIVFGPKKLPEIGRQIGKAMAEFKRASNEFKAQIESEMRQIEYEEARKKDTPPVLQAPEGAVVNSSVFTPHSGEAPALPETTPTHTADA